MRAFVFVLACVSITAAACVAEPEELPPPEPVAKQSFNSLPENAIADYAFELNRLVTEPFRDGPSMRALSMQEKGLRLLEYSARCTLPVGMTIPLLSYKGPVTIPNGPPLGLAPDWPNRGLSLDEQEWLMACLLAHINAQGQSVWISVRGPHAALATTPAEVASFTYLEGAFYGEFGDWSDPDSADLTIQRACYGPALAQCGPAAPTILYGRLCTIPGGCPHLRVTGPCEAAPPTPRACLPRAGDAYDTCYGSAFTGLPAGRQYKAVATTYLKDFKCPR
jgi:hypothetical protein